MKIAFVTNNIVDPCVGGTERVTLSVARILRRRGIESVFVAARHAAVVGVDADAEFAQYLLPDQPATASSANVAYLCQLIKDEGVAVVVNQDGYDEGISQLCMSIREKSMAKLVSAIHFSVFDEYRWFGRRFKPVWQARKCNEMLKLLATKFRLPMLRRRALANRVATLHRLAVHSDAITVLSDSFRREVESAIANLPQPKAMVEVMPNPNSFNRIEHSAAKENIVLYVGRMTYEQKRADRVVAMWRRLWRRYPLWRLVMVGDGPELQHVKSMAEGMGNVEIVGRADSRPWYERAKIICLTSNYEGFGMTLTEGMQHGCVPVAFGSYGAVTDIIDDSTDGFIIRPFSIKEYAGKVASLMGDDAMWQRMSDAAIRKVDKFSEEAIGDRWVKFLERLTNEDIAADN